MQQTWTLHIKNFGKIREASVAIKPMTLFIGKNNTGKSYLSTLLWGLLAAADTLFPKNVPESKAYLKCDQWLQHIQEAKKVEFSSEQYNLFIDWFNVLLIQRKGRLLTRLFNDSSVEIEKLQITEYQRNRRLFIEWINTEGTKPPMKFTFGKEYIRIQYGSKQNKTERYKICQRIVWKLLFGGMSVYSPFTAKSVRRQCEPVFLPASRTGFMLTYKPLVVESLDQYDEYGDEKDESSQQPFTLPIIRFLQSISEFSSKKAGKYAEIASWLEREILQGEIKVVAHAVPDFLYQPVDVKTALPLHISSSLVTELSPLVLFLKHKADLRTLFIEEPEAHLHLEAQRILARALARLVNLGLPVLMTTHSDTFFQQINNLICLRCHSRQKKLQAQLGYQNEELLSSDQVAAYEFIATNKETIVKALPLKQGGFAAPSFNAVLIDLAQETLKLQAENDED